MFGAKKKRERVHFDKQAFKKAKRILKFMKPYRLNFYIGLIFLALSSSTIMLFPYLMGKLMGTNQAKTSWDLMSGNNEINIDLENINTIAVLLFCTFGALAIFSYFRIRLFSIFTENSLRDIRKQAFSTFLKYPIDFFNKNKVGELTSRIATDINLLQETLNTTLAEFLRQFITIGIGVSYLFYSSTELALWMLATLPIIIVVSVIFGRFIKKLSVQAQDTAAESNGQLEEVLNTINNVKSFTNEAYEERKYFGLNDVLRNLYVKSAKWRGGFVSFILFSMFSVITFIVWKGANLVASGEMAADTLFSFMLFTIFVGASFGSLPDLYAKIIKTIGATEKLVDLLELDQENVGKVSDPIRIGNVSFQNVSFSYPQRPDVQVLNNINFEVNAGETVAMVGSSGSGKTTIAALILSFYQPNSGSIIFDNCIDSSYLKTVRESIGYVPQEVILFGGSIKENIAYGDLDASDEEIREAARKANALDFIESFPDKWDTIVGARGIQLSGGQRQRIAIARALLKNPKILILDEATSALDSESEKLVQDALDKLMEGRTSFVIAHRLSTIKNADKILVLDQGEIKEVGSHHELVEKQGIYAHLHELQISD